MFDQLKIKSKNKIPPMGKINKSKSLRRKRLIG